MGKVGFIGLGIMGKPMASNLLKAGFEVVVYNRTQAKCDELVKLGATAAKTPAEVVGACDTTVCMLADPKACLEVALGENGITSAIEAGKAVVDMSTVDAATSAQIYEAVKAKGGRFLEAPVSGSKKPAEDGALVILGAGDKDVYDESLPLFEVMGKKSVYLGDIGNGAKMKLVVNMMLGCMTTTVSARADEAENRTRARTRERERERERENADSNHLLPFVSQISVLRGDRPGGEVWPEQGRVLRRPERRGAAEPVVHHQGQRREE